MIGEIDSVRALTYYGTGCAVLRDFASIGAFALAAQPPSTIGHWSGGVIPVLSSPDGITSRSLSCVGHAVYDMSL
jgi:hypothetical protein